MRLKNVFFFLLLIVVTSSCFKYEDVQLKSVHNFKLNSLNENNLDLEIEIELYNPNNYKIGISKADLDVQINQLLLGHAVLNENINLPAKESTKQTIKLNTKLDENFQSELPGVLAQAIFSGLKLKVDGQISGKAMWFPKSIEVHHEEKISLKDLDILN